MSAPIAPCASCDLGDLYPPADPMLDVCEACLPRSGEPDEN
jgi:hypothetical protein